MRVTRGTALTRTRGLLSGSFCALGALAAHALSEGFVSPVTAGLLLPVAVLVSTRLAGSRVDPVRLAAGALLAQAVSHFLMVVSAPTGGDHTGNPVAMLLTHGAVAAVTVMLCRGAEQTLLDLLLELVLPALLRVRSALPSRPPRQPLADPDRPGTQHLRGPRAPRGPPVVLPA